MQKPKTQSNETSQKNTKYINNEKCRRNTELVPRSPVLSGRYTLYQQGNPPENSRILAMAEALRCQGLPPAEQSSGLRER